MTRTIEVPRRLRALLPAFGLVAGLGGLAGVISCNDDDDNLVGPLTSGVAVFKDDAFNFATLRTFSMPDTIVQFTPITGAPLPVTRQFDAVALTRVRQNLFARGYTEVSDPRVATPTFIVLVSSAATNNFNAFANFSWFTAWGFFPGWAFFPGFATDWGIVFPWVGTTGVASFDRGTLIVEIIPTTSVNTTSRTIRAAWAGVASAALAGSVDANRVAEAVDQMFALSPYLVASGTVFNR